MQNVFARFLSSLAPAFFLRLVLTVALTSGSVLIAYGREMGYKLLIGCNLFTAAGAFYLEYRQFRAREDAAGK